MNGIIELNGTIRIKSMTADQWATVNPKLAADEPGRESDTGRMKVGDGVSAWLALPYLIDPAASASIPPTPALAWKVSEGMLYVCPNVAFDNPILTECYVGILRYKNPRHRIRPTGEVRPSVKGYKVVQDINSRPTDLPWTNVRITPIKVDIPTLINYGGWMPVISVESLFGRFVETKTNALYAGGKQFKIHRGRDVVKNIFGPGYDGKIRQKASVYCGVVLFRYSSKKSIRYEGPRALFKVCMANYAPHICIVPMS
ncbi:hypothetical protein [Alistipes senegalensis]|uniref:hyaluronate lyase N-terminal domain-containing protein n=1 Tax=Alistipes senegalensis TaxID=1288121 RepID=UPI0018A9921E|nr:hypothetical protein [Alistipes senegalensis]